MVFMDFGTPICIPYAYKARDLMDLLHPLMTAQGLKEVTQYMMLRQFAKLWRHQELLGVLGTTCLVCPEEMRPHQIKAHLEVTHDLSQRRFQYHIQQLALIATNLQSDEFACDYCGAYLQVDVHGYSLVARTLDHLQECPPLLQMAVLLGHPTWETTPWPDIITWPDQATLWNDTANVICACGNSAPRSQIVQLLNT